MPEQTVKIAVTTPLDYSGRVELFFENGVLARQMVLPPEYITGSVDGLVELLNRAGWKITPPSA